MSEAGEASVRLSRGLPCNTYLLICDMLHGMPCSSASIILHRSLHLKDVVYMGVEVPRQAADGVQVVHINTASGGIVQVVTNMKIDNLAQHQAVRAMPDGKNLYHPALHINRRFRHAGRFDLYAGGGCQTR